MPKQFEHWIQQPIEVKPKEREELNVILITDPRQWEVGRRMTVGQIRDAISRAINRSMIRN